MTILIDTNAAIALIRGEPASVRQHFQAAVKAGEEIFLSSVSLFELWYGVSNSRRVHTNTERLLDFLSGPIHIAEFGELEAARAGHIRAELSAQGTPIGPYDLLIAAHAVRNKYTLVTANGREFDRVGHLTMVDWSAP
ncbi:type II toxin-antitoxin system VapC family toxin [Phytoactinopolyspora mesophila]|uniref:Ribonuclease VapC n=1 Tax=Phytoactinopolyspora mesophila TaxID=2650750 RepID=A0A7K3MAH6_9ACTN|nr:type II toxin-antitoxin system VapC family toxin [Phytoactinopolyspora mesophila]NDL60309.1 PIN domain-containing protein [Phytoactinopolyspora mesophila]